jgi:Crinkler effector protein N-terminal domain
MPVLWCLLIDNKYSPFGDEPFSVNVPAGTNVDNLKEIVKVRGQHTLQLVDAFHLRVWKWTNGLDAYDKSVSVGKPIVSDFFESSVRLRPWDVLTEAPNDLFLVVTPTPQK